MRSYSLLLVGAANVLAAVAAHAANRDDLLDSASPVPREWTSTGSFSGLSARGPDNVRFTTGDAWQVRAEGDPRTLERLRFALDDGRLVVGRRSGNDDLPPATVYVTAPALDRATLAGSGLVSIDRLSGDTVSATVAGAGDLTVASLAATTMKGTLAGSGDLAVTGRANEAKVTVAGSGRFEGQDFITDRAEITIAGSGNMAFRSDGSVVARISGSGRVRVTGKATCRQSRSGSGSLTCGV